MALILTKDPLTDAITGVRLSTADGVVINFGQESRLDPGIVGCQVLENLGLTFCPHCTNSWDYIDDAPERIRIFGYACRRCKIGFVSLTKLREAPTYYTTGAQTLLPCLATFEPDTVTTCRATSPTVALNDGILGLNIATSHLVGMYPRGLGLLASTFGAAGNQIFARLATTWGLAPKDIWGAFPARTGIYTGWLILDTNLYPIVKQDPEIHKRAYPNDTGLDYVIPLVKQLQDLTGQAGTASQIQKMLACAKALGILSSFSSDSWKAKLESVLAPMGGADKVMKPRKVRVRGVGL